MARTALVKTTAANQISCANYASITGLAITASVPTGTDMRFAVKIGDGNWQTYAGSAWDDLADQDITAANILTNGNTKAQLEALDSTALAALVGAAKVNFAVAMSKDDATDNYPSLTSIVLSGQSNDRWVQDTVDSEVIQLAAISGQAVQIIAIDVEKSEVAGGSVEVLASVEDEGGSWSEYQPYADLVGTSAQAIKFRGVLNSPNPGTSSATLTSVSIRHRTDNLAVFSEGTGVCVTKTFNFVNGISRAHLMVKHPKVADTEVTAEIALREPPTTVTGEVLGDGTGAQQTVTVAHAQNLASHGFVLYFDDVVQPANTYSFSPSDGQVTFNAPSGASVTADYIYDWTDETFVSMTHDTEYPDKDDNNLVDDQFDYMATRPGDPTGSVGTVRVSLRQGTGTITDEALGFGNGTQQSFKLAHHAKPETIVVQPADAVWKYRDNTDVLQVTAAEGAPISVSYKYAARTNYIESLACIFNE